MRSSNGHILITGTTGALGSEIVRWLVGNGNSREVYFLIRAASEQELARRWRRVLAVASDGKRDPEDIPNFQPLRGDITEPNLGIDGVLLRQIQNNVTQIVHAAADVKFSSPLKSARETNVEGTRNVLSFAKHCGRLEQLAHVSTVFSSGKRSGLVLEKELEHSSGFLNNYEQTKFEAEMLVRKQMEELPIAVYRFALMPGNASGYVHRFGLFHRGMQFYCYGLLPILPGFPSTLIDMVPTSYGAKAMLMLFFHHFKSGQTYQICNGKDAIPLKDFFELVERTFSELTPPWKTGVFESPEIVDVETYKLFTKTAHEAGNSTFKHIARIMDSYVYQLVHPKIFNGDLVESSLHGSIPKPSIRDFFPRVLRYCVAADWGKRVMEETSNVHETGRVRVAVD